MDITFPPQGTSTWPAVGGMGGGGLEVGMLVGSEDGGGGGAAVLLVHPTCHASFSRSSIQVSDRYRPPAGRTIFSAGGVVKNILR